MSTDTQELTQVGAIAIRPYIEGQVENMGLENYGMVLFPEVHHEEDLACITRNGVDRYINGLDEFSSYIQGMKDKSLQKAEIKHIRKEVSRLEAMLGDNHVKVDDEDFWNKIVTLKPSNHDFWKQFSVRCGNNVQYLDPEDPHQYIIIKAIEAGGFSIVAKSFEEARGSQKPPKFYLDKLANTVKTRTEVKKLRNKALGLLDELYENNRSMFMQVCKLADAHSAQYKKSTPLDVMYENMDNYINGLGVEKNKKRAAKTFIDAAELDPETRKIRALVKDAGFYKIIGTMPDGILYYLEDRTALGKNVSDVILYLKDATNEDVLMKIMEKVEKEWNN